jgi:hypothetical protein
MPNKERYWREKNRKQKADEAMQKLGNRPAYLGEYDPKKNEILIAGLNDWVEQHPAGMFQFDENGEMYLHENWGAESEDLELGANAERHEQMVTNIRRLLAELGDDFFNLSANVISERSRQVLVDKNGSSIAVSRRTVERYRVFVRMNSNLFYNI